MSNQNLVIVGASLAGTKAAEGARDAGFEGRIILVGDEPTLPYERPPLSKEVLRGEKKTDGILVHTRAFFDENAVELVVDRATRLDVVSRTVELEGGPAVPFDSVVLTTGARPRRLELPGADLEGVHYLRTVHDSVVLHEALKGAQRVAVVGAGWIGCEVAASARQLGAAVVMIDPGPAPLHRVVGDELGAVFTQLHADHGVELRLGRGVAALAGGPAVTALLLDDGTVEGVDAVVVGIGVKPRTELADEAVGVRVDDGVVVDRYLRANVEGVFAAGDVANAWHPHFERHLRVEHWANALNQGLTAGRNAAGRNEPYERLPYFYSDQYDLGLEYVGHHRPGDAVVVRGDVDARKLIAFWHRDGVVSAGMAINVWDAVEDLKALISSRASLKPARLADPDTPLSELLPKEMAS